MMTPASEEVPTPSQAPTFDKFCPPQVPAPSQSPSSTSNVTPQQRANDISRVRDRADSKKQFPACQRCRRLKKRCSRTFPECLLCVGAGLPCSISEVAGETPETISMKARIEWLSKIVNENLRLTSRVEILETGVDIKGLITNGSLAIEASAARTFGTEILPDHSAVAAVLAAMSGGKMPEITQASQHRDDPGWSKVSQPFSCLPLDSACRRFVAAYFRHVHRAYPFVDQKSTLFALESLQSLENVQSKPASTKLYLIMAIGCTTLERAGQIPNDTSNKFVILYTSIVQQCLESPSVESAEVLLLLSLYSLFDPSGLSPWTMVGFLTRQAISIGITRDTPREKSPASSELELRHRLYWSILVLDRMVSVYMGLPNGFNDDNSVVSLPGVTVQEFGASDRLQLTFSLQISRHVIQLRQLEDKILKKIHLASRTFITSLSGADKRVMTHDLRSQIENWYSHGCLLSPPENDNIPFHNSISWLTVRYYNLLILLYQPSHFNSELSHDQLSSLQQYIQKYVQSSAVLVQQRQLPLNWITLYRLLPVCSILLYCYARLGHRSFAARLEVATCAEILESFPQRWTIAVRSAQVFREFAAIAIPNSNAETSLSPVSTRHSGLHGSEASGCEGRNAAKIQELAMEANQLVSEVLGKCSTYTYIDTLMKHSSDWEHPNSMNHSWTDVQLENGFENGTSWQGFGMDFL